MGVLLLWATGVEASTSQSIREQSRINEIREELKALEKQDTVMLEGSRTALYREYENPSEALERLKERVPETLKRLQEQSTERLEDLSEQNWEKYELLAIPYETSWNIDQERWEEVIIILQFFDIYENTFQNNQIKGKIASISWFPSNKETYTKDIKNIKMLLPFASISTRTSIGLNFNDAKNYAETYAKKPNKSQYDVFWKDCTNFVSQILEAGGIAQEVYDDEYSGRWHKSEDHWWGKSHTHSISFIRADTFAKYMGIWYTSTNHRNFSNNIRAGDIIGFDRWNDWDWEHMAFVTDKKWYEWTYNGKTYSNYRVAQHTINYNDWVNEDSNGRENLEDQGYAYGRIRR